MKNNTENQAKLNLEDNNSTATANENFNADNNSSETSISQRNKKTKTDKKSCKGDLQQEIEKHLKNEDLIAIKERLLILDDKKKKVAKMIGITDVYLSYILNGKRKLTSNVKAKLFDYLGLSN
ncbi:MAG: helix-turn-helix transcriptional regulator [Marinifilaceae bacterium]|jgi:hypothetical protein|nr:helix-turn-helix transcriptional regulator [Marinifilaceae bacterium]